jgi:hypothetical protein
LPSRLTGSVSECPVAAVSKKSPVSKKRPVAKVATKAKAAPKGLQLSAAQWKAYNKAYSSSISAQALTRATTAFRKYRMRAYVKTLSQYNHVAKATQTAAIAAYATRMSWIQARDGHQNAALQSRIEEDMYKHQNALGRLQYAQAGEKRYLARALARTVDTPDARAHEENVIAAAERARSKAAKSVTAKKYRKSKKPRNKAANAAGMRAADAPSLVAAAGKQRAATRAKARATAQKTAKATVAKNKAARSASKKATVVSAKKRGAPAGAGFTKRDVYTPWIGDPDSPLCVPVAIANHLLYTTGVRMDDVSLGRFMFNCPYNPTIEQALEILKGMRQRGPVPWALQFYSPVGSEYRFSLLVYERVPARYAHSTGLVVGYQSEYGPHAALSLGNGTVVSWGQEIPNDAKIEEAWMLDWVASGRL